MKFNFKEALETLEDSKIIEGKADKFMNLSFDLLKEHILDHDLNIDDGCYFKLGILDCSNHFSNRYDLMAFCYRDDASYDLGSMTFEKFGAADSVLEIIENELNNEGFLCTPDKKPGFFKVIKVTF